MNEKKNVILYHAGCPYEAAIKAAENDAKIRAGEIADEQTTTPNGCTCNSLCGATIEDAYGLDWCYVDGECGNYRQFFHKLSIQSS